MLLDKGQEEAFGLLQTLAEISPAALGTICEISKADVSWAKARESLPLVGSILDIPGALPLEVVETSIKAAVHALTDKAIGLSVADSARVCLAKLATLSPDAVDAQLGNMRLGDFSAAHAALANDLANISKPTNSLAHLVNLGLQAVTRFCSSDGKLDDTNLAVIEDLFAAIKTAARLDIVANLAEPVITAVVQERLNSPSVVAFATLLVEKSMLKVSFKIFCGRRANDFQASFIRQQISLLLSSSTYRQLASPIGTPPSDVREAYVNLLSAMFTANPYISCQPATIEQFLPLYKGTLSLSDQRLLTLFQLFESYRHISVGSVLSAWSSGPGRSGRPFDAMTTLDPGKMFATAVAFPLRRPLRGVHAVEDGQDASTMYDPAFALTLFAATLATEINGLDWVEILRTNILGVAVTALSSRDHEMRSLGGFVLSGTMSYLKASLHRFIETTYADQTESGIPGETAAGVYSTSIAILYTAPVVHLEVAPEIASNHHDVYGSCPAISRFARQSTLPDHLSIPASKTKV